MLASNLSGTKGERGTKGPSKTKATPPERAPLPPTRMSPQLRQGPRAYGKIQAASCEKTALSFGENFCWTEIQKKTVIYT